MAAELGLARDLNAIGDANKRVRKRGCSGLLNKCSDLESKGAEPQVWEEVCALLLPRCMGLLSDESDGVREGASTLLLLLLQHASAEQQQGLGSELLGVLRSRVAPAAGVGAGNAAAAESVEEVRLLYAQLLLFTVKELGETAIAAGLEDCVCMWEVLLCDPAPDVRVCAADAALLACKFAAVASSSPSSRILRSCVKAAFPHASSEVSTGAVPSLLRLTADRAVPVRVALCGELRKWLSTGSDNVVNSQSQIVQALLSAAADQQDEVAKAAGAAIAAAGSISSGGDGVIDGECVPLNGLPPRLASQWLSSQLVSVVQGLIAGAADWTVGARCRSLLSLGVLCWYCRDGMAAHAEQLLKCLVEATADGDAEVGAAAEVATKHVGESLPPSSFSSVWDGKSVSGDESGVRARLAVTARLLQPSVAPSAALEYALLMLSQEATVSVLPQTLAYLVSAEVSDCSSDGVFCATCAAASAAAAAVGAAGCENEQVRTDLARVALRVASARHSADSDLVKLGGAAASTVEAVASALGVEGIAGLRRNFGDRLLPQLLEAAASWTGLCGDRALFDDLVVGAGASLLPYREKLLKLAGIVADVDASPEVRCAWLLLVRAAFLVDDTAAVLVPIAEAWLRDIIAPAMVWRVGVVAASVRHAAVRTLMPVLGAVSRSEVDKVVKAKVCETIISMRPSWKSCLDDDRSDIRFAAAEAAEPMIAILADESWEDLQQWEATDQARELSLLLLAKLDDANDAVRVVGAKALAKSLSYLPHDYDSGQVDYICNSLLVHLDDDDEGVRDAAALAGSSLAKVSPSRVLRHAEDNRSKHRHKGPIDLVLSAATAAGGSRVS